MKNVFCIRADANHIVGMGHLMRTLSIANELRNLGEEVIFVLADAENAWLPQKQGFETIVLSTNYAKMDEELEIFLPILERRNVKGILLDSYYVTETYMKALQGVCSLFYMDDINAFAYPCEGLINYAAQASKAMYAQLEKGTVCWCGPTFAPLRLQFKRLPQHVIKREIENILLLSGSTDSFNFLCQMAKALRKVYSKQISVITSNMNIHKEELEEMTRKDEKLSIYYNVENMAEHMKDTDLAITAGGVTTFELAASGVPMIAYSMADNQLPNVHQLEKEGLLLYAGDLRAGVENVLDNILGCLKTRYTMEFRGQMSKIQQKLIDGTGAESIARELIQYSK